MAASAGRAFDAAPGDAPGLAPTERGPYAATPGEPHSRATSAHRELQHNYCGPKDLKALSPNDRSRDADLAWRRLPKYSQIPQDERMAGPERSSSSRQGPTPASPACAR